MGSRFIGTVLLVVGIETLFGTLFIQTDGTWYKDTVFVGGTVCTCVPYRWYHDNKNNTKTTQKQHLHSTFQLELS